MIIRRLPFLVALLFTLSLSAENNFKKRKDSIQVNTINKDFIIHVKKAADRIKLDGLLDEKSWDEAEKVSNFYMVLPYDTGHCKAKTYVMMTYDKKALYCASVFFDSLPGKRPVESLRRDWVFTNNDNFMFLLDPF
jgi:hypothetical protein